MASDSRTTSNYRASVQSESSPTTGSTAQSIAEPSVSNLHHRLTLLASQVHQLRASRTGKVNVATDWRLRGRAIRRLVTLSDSITDILAEADRRGASDMRTQTFSKEEDWHYRCYKELVIRVPELMRWIDETEDMNELDSIIKKVRSFKSFVKPWGY
ncbi:hypothetical protein JVT61DRAFT_5895 [Boletus reticuloceps]|uniref:Uncharacterized protein n=1 Tax=Boletus reticuloceps TaxID=495285 RepID=A0A8I2YM99_9AGAM|nr:hypothetical protein JVT61DRAFT_5895 [Boletus reticuloceps]